jgi:hypothetical protein
VRRDGDAAEDFVVTTAVPMKPPQLNVGAARLEVVEPVSTKVPAVVVHVSVGAPGRERQRRRDEHDREYGRPSPCRSPPHGTA